MNADVRAVLDGTMRWAAWKGDCRRFLEQVPPGTFHLTLGSPPYEDRRTYGKEVNFKLKGQAWVDWMKEVIILSLAGTNGLCAFVLQGKTADFAWSATPCLLVADLVRAGVHVRNPLIYYRHGVMGSGGKDWVRSDYEWVICCQSAPGRLPWSEPTACGHTPRWSAGGAASNRLTDGKRVNQWGGGKASTHGRRQNGEHQPPGSPSHVYTSKKGDRTNRERDGSQRQQTYRPPAISNPGSVLKETYTAEEVVAILSLYGVGSAAGDVLRMKVGGNVMGHKLAHKNEAPYPLHLAEFLVRTWCPPDGLVFAPFLGSGTDAHACLLRGRRCIGTDLRQSQIDLARQRCEGVGPLLIDTPPPVAFLDSAMPTAERLAPIQQLLFGETEE